ncbi:MAG: hypothetical protein LBV30_02485 [Propionibacteriaceae bacterium]|jgi:hypothetical protein|nr:hypothetical protein [Propionibacteriaceae bacterium]
MSALERFEIAQSTPSASPAVVAPVAVKTHHWAALPLLIIGLMALGMVGHLWLATQIQVQGRQIVNLEATMDSLTAENNILTAQITIIDTPSQLAQRAVSLGMVPEPQTSLLVVPTGQILGVDQAVTGSEMPIITAASAIGNGLTWPSLATADTGGANTSGDTSVASQLTDTTTPQV